MRSIIAAAVVLSGSTLSMAAIDTLSPVQAGLGAFSLQNTQSSFGGGNVLAAAYASVSGGRLDLLVTGRLGTGNERFVLFVDNGNGGGAAAVPDGLFGLGGGAAGMAFDGGFAPQTAIVANGDGGTVYVDYNGGIGGTPTSVFAGLGARNNGGTPLAFAGSGAPDIRASLNDSFAGGVFGFGLLGPTEAAAYAGATTGIGLSIPLDALGIANESATFRVMALILGGDGSTISNQILAPISGQEAPFNSYPAAAVIDFRQFAGDQFFTIPTPGAAGLMGLALLAAGRRRR